jgi:amino acid permease
MYTYTYKIVVISWQKSPWLSNAFRIEFVFLIFILIAVLIIALSKPYTKYIRMVIRGTIRAVLFLTSPAWATPQVCSLCSDCLSL